MSRTSFLLVFWLVFTANDLISQVNPFIKLNTQFDEQNPVLSPDGQTLYFTRSNHPQNIGGERDPGDIWYSTLGPEGWSRAIHASKINSYDWNGVIGFTENGDLILHNHYATGSLLKTQGFSISKRVGAIWQEPVNISIPYFKTHSSVHGGSISSDGNVMFLSLETYGTRGAEDIYVLFKENDKWKEPKNLGDVINSSFQEFTPFISGDSILYFASNGHDGAESTDIFMSKRLGDGWFDWSKPQKIEKVNSEGRELGYRLYNGFAIYTSTLNSDGYSDIKFYTASDKPDTIFNEAPTEFALKEITAENIPENKMMVYGEVLPQSGSDRSFDPVLVIRSSKGDKPLEIKINQNLYMTNLDSPGEYLITVSAPGYIAEQENLELVSSAAKKIQLNFSLEPIAVGTRVNLEDVLFEQSKDVFLESSYTQLDLVAQMMKDNPDMKIMLEGHTDNLGNPKHNLRLSKMRVEAVEEYLISKGISGRRIKGKGYGGSQPLIEKDDPELRKLNRRVEFIIIKN